MRASLAGLLLLRPSLLLLDEPTNHLDLESLAWLEGYLADYDGAVVVVSHDRYFLNRMVTTIAELGPGGFAVYPGTYDDFLVEREARRTLREAQARNQAKKVAEVERFIERFRAKATKARQVQSRVKMLDRMERIELDPVAREIRLAFPAPPRTGRRVARAAGAPQGLRRPRRVRGDRPGGRAGRPDRAGRHQRGGQVHPAPHPGGHAAVRAGRAVLGTQVTTHFYAQHQLDALDPARTVLEELTAVAPDGSQTRLRTLLGAFLFSGDAVDKKIAVLSGGEKARVALAKMLVRPAPFLCLDEPTNHLDLASRERLEAALEAFPGTMVFISHDRYFINRLATKVVEVARGRLTTHPGNYDDYRAVVDRPRPRRRLPPGRRPPRRSRRRAARRRARVDPAVRELRRRVEEIERQIHALEDRLRELGEALGDPALYADGERARAVAGERRQAEEQIAWLMHEWEELSTALAAHE